MNSNSNLTKYYKGWPNSGHYYNKLNELLCFSVYL